MIRRTVHSAIGCAAFAVLFVFTASAQTNVLVNGDFETNPPPKLGDNPNHSIAPWQLGSGNQANVVKVDGPAGFDYFQRGPESDASAPGTGIAQHYLDIVGVNDFFQTFTPRCSGTVTFGGSFSTRDNLLGTGTVSVRQGAGTSGMVIGATNPILLPAGNSKTNPWQQVTFTASIAAGQTYSFVVRMDNNLNFDNGFVRYPTECEPPDPCCPPWSSSTLEQMLFYQGSSAITGTYTLKFQPTPAFSNQMNAYINYVRALNPAASGITIQFRLHDAGNGNAPVLGAQVGSPQSATWTGTGTPMINFFTNPPHTMMVNEWYIVRTRIFLENGQVFFPDSCADNDVAVRIQVRHVAGGVATNVMEIRRGDGRVLEIDLR